MADERAGTLTAARGGDGAAFQALVEPHLRELHVHCYRMLGSLDAADDALQEVLVAAWRGLDGFAGRSSVRTWLYTIATRRCLNVLRTGRRRAPEVPLPFAAPDPDGAREVAWLQPYPDAWLPRAQAAGPAQRYDARESVELAFVAALQVLPPRQVAAVVLVDVLGYTPAEVASMLGAAPTAVKGLLQRGRTSLERRRAGDPPHDAEVDRAVAARFASALASGDVESVVTLLTDDGWLAMPPLPHVYRGRESVGRFLAAARRWRGGRAVRFVETRANGRLALLGELEGPHGPAPAGVYVLTTTRGRLASATRFLGDDLHDRFTAPCPRP